MAGRDLGEPDIACDLGHRLLMAGVAIAVEENDRDRTVS